MIEEQRFGTKRMSMCLSVRGALKRLNASRAKKSEFSDEGRPLTRLEAIDGLHDELAAGRETLPMNKECKNPCTYADKGCKGFNYGKNGGCPGYWLPPDVEAECA
jgi:hypothetical protein